MTDASAQTGLSHTRWGKGGARRRLPPIPGPSRWVAVPCQVELGVPHVHRRLSHGIPWFLLDLLARGHSCWASLLAGAGPGHSRPSSARRTALLVSLQHRSAL